MLILFSPVSLFKQNMEMASSSVPKLPHSIAAQVLSPNKKAAPENST